MAEDLYRGSGHHLLLFARVPVAGSCKTRLIPRLGEQGSARFARSALIDLLHLLSKVPLRKTWFFTPPSAQQEALSLLRDEGLAWTWGVEAQTEAPHLGLRLTQGLEWANQAQTIEGGNDDGSVTFIGMDCFDLSPDKVMDAVAGTEGNVAHVLPARDGGYVLLSLPAGCPSSVFENVPWSCEETRRVQVTRIMEAGLSVTIGEELDDVDEPEDLDRLWGSREQKKALFPRSIECLDRLMEDTS